VLTARDGAQLQAVAEAIRAAGGRADVEAFDLLDEAAVVAAVPRIVARHGRLDILVNNAGICVWGGLLDSTLEVWRRTIDTNLTAVYQLAREAARQMTAQRYGRIVNISSYVAAIGRERLQAYVASKHGVTGLTKSLAGELGRHGVTCNAVAPGIFETEMAAPVMADPARLKVFTDAIALGRLGRPDELVGAVQFLASDAAAYITGHTIHVDGGIVAALSLPVAVTSPS
jgi:gluconate 5-dehydrogenase